jgi:hypothetical protein
MNMPGTYAVYLAVSIGFTIWVARTLHHHGRPFLVVCFSFQEKLADAVNGDDLPCLPANLGPISNLGKDPRQGPSGSSLWSALHRLQAAV